MSSEAKGLHNGPGSPNAAINTAGTVEGKDAIEALRASEERFRLSFDQSPIGTAIVFMDYRYHRVNDAMCRITGYTRDELLALSPWDITHPGDLSHKGEIERTLLSGQTSRYERDKRYIRKDGTVVWVSLSASLIRNAERQPLGYLSMVTDITARKQIEIRQSLGNRVLGILNQSQDTREMIRQVLPLLKDLSGFDAVGIRLRQGEDCPYFETSGLSNEFVEAERSLCALDAENRVVRDNQGQACLECLCGDVICGRTDPAQPWFTPGGSFWTNNSPQTADTLARQPRSTRLRGRCVQVGYQSMALVPLRRGSEIIGLIQFNDKRAGRCTVELVKFLEGLATSIGTALARAQAEEALQESEDKFKYVFDHSVIGRSLTLLSGEIKANQALYDMLGYTQAELQTKQWPEITHPDDIDLTQRGIDQLLSGALNSARFVKRFIHKNGSVLWTDVSSSLRRDKDGKPLHLMTSVIDITERKQAEEKLRASEEKFAKAFVHGPVLMTLAAFADGTYFDVNEKFLEISGFSRDEVIGRKSTELEWMTPDDRARMIETLNERGNVSGLSMTFTAKGGRKIEGLLYCEIVIIDGHQYVLASVVDVTDRNRAEELVRKHQVELAHLARVTAVGEMASTLAHELNQPLGAIQNYSGLCLDLLEKNALQSAALAEAIKEISRETKRSGEIIRRLRSFLRTHEPSMEPTHINDVVQEAIGLVGIAARHQGVLVRAHLGVDLPQVRADPILIEQVLINLLQNGLDAMKDSDSAHRAMLVKTSRSETGSVHISVTDAGTGIASDVQDRLFESFFTTKPNGMGMGLPISRSIVESHGGHLTFSPNPDRGVTFEFTVPEA